MKAVIELEQTIDGECIVKLHDRTAEEHAFHAGSSSISSVFGDTNS
jgi:hypothetical protein